MIWKRVGLVAALIGAGTGIAGCADQYGYGGVSAGYGYADSYAGGYGYGDPYGYGYGYPSYFGWYGDFYYPGSGIYVYDRDRRPFRWNGDQRRFWEGRRNGSRGNRDFPDNWNGFAQRPNGPGPGYGNSYPGRGAFNGQPGRPGANGRAGENVYRRDGAQGRSYGGRWRNPSGVAAPQEAGPSTAVPQGAPSTAGPQGGGGREWGGGGRGGRGGRGRP